MVQSNKIKAELFNWGIAVDDNHDSGWKITKKSENLSTEDCKELRLKTRSGEISLNWMEKIKNGYGYFGRWKDQAVFAHYYISPVESDRGSYFIPKDVMTIPYKSYIEKFKCDNLMILESFPPPQNQISNRTDDEPEEIRESLFLQIKSRSLKDQLERVKNRSLPDDILIKLLSSYLLPSNFCTVLLWPESDAELLISMLSLLPPSLRQFMTFCTCVSRPSQAETKIRVIEEPLGLDRLENYTLLDIRADSIKFRKEYETGTEKSIARALIQLFTEKPEELEPFHDEIESMVKNRQIDTSDYNKVIYLVQEICISWNTHHMFNRLPGFNAKIKKLREFLDEDKTSRKEVIPIFIDTLKQAHHHEVINNLDIINILLNETKPLEPEEHNLFKDYLSNSFRKIDLNKDTPILDVFWSHEDLKKYIIEILFDNRTRFVGNPDWDTWEAFFYKFENPNILLQFIKKDDIQEKLIQSEEGKIFLLIQDVIIWADEKQDLDDLEKSEKRILSMDDKSHLIRLFILCFRFLPPHFNNKENALGFLYLASVIYSLRWGEEKENRIEIFKRKFVELYSGLYFLRSINEVDKTIYQLNDRIVKKINQCDPTLGREIEDIIDVSKILDSFRQVDQLLKDIIESSLFEKNGIKPFIQMFRSIHQIARNDNEKETLLPRILDYILMKEVVAPVKFFTAFLEYYELKNGGETNLKVLFSALKSNPTPLEDIDFFKRVLQVLLKQKDSNVRIQLVNLLLYLLKGVFIRKALEEVNFFSVFRDIFRVNWKPESAEELKSVYESVRYCFGLLHAMTFLEIMFDKITADEKTLFNLSDLYQKLKELGFIFKQKSWALGKNPERYQQLLDFLDFFENIDNFESLRFDKRKLDRKMDDIRVEIDAFSNTLGSIETILKKLKNK